MFSVIKFIALVPVSSRPSPMELHHQAKLAVTFEQFMQFKLFWIYNVLSMCNRQCDSFHCPFPIWLSPRPLIKQTAPPPKFSKYNIL